MTVWEIIEYYNNGEEYEDQYYDSSTVAIATTKEKALEYIKELELPEGYEEAKPFYVNTIREFKGTLDEYGGHGWYEYTIKKTEVI